MADGGFEPTVNFTLREMFDRIDQRLDKIDTRLDGLEEDKQNRTGWVLGRDKAVLVFVALGGVMATIVMGLPAWTFYFGGG